MNDFFNTLQKTARETRLTRDEKQVMRMRLHQAIEQSHVFDAPAEKISAYAPVRSPYQWFSMRFAMPVVAVLLIVGLGTGTAYAAQGSLPGNPLYPIKINVNETIQTALATTPVAKAEVNASLAQQRLEEAEDLASQGKLDATTSQELAANFDEHAGAAQQITTDLQAQDPAAAAQLSAEFDSSLVAHGAVLAQLGSDSDSTTTQQSSTALAERVRSHEEGGIVLAVAPQAQAQQGQRGARAFAALSAKTAATASSSEPMAAAMVASSSATTTSLQDASGKRGTVPTTAQQMVATRMQSKAQSAVDQLQGDYTDVHDLLSAQAIAQIDMQIAAIAESMSMGSTTLAAGDPVRATANFTSALRAATQLDVFVQAGKRFNAAQFPNLLNTLLDNDSHGDASSTHEEDSSGLENAH